MNRREFLESVVPGLAEAEVISKGGDFASLSTAGRLGILRDIILFAPWALNGCSPKPESNLIEERGNKASVVARPDSLLPADTLTEEELRAANITIYQTPITQLYLRREALKIPIFQDAANGKLDGVVISLVDHDRLSWAAIDKLPDDARLIFQALESHPSEWSEKSWNDVKRYTQEVIEFEQHYHQQRVKDLAILLNGEEEANVKKRLSFYQKWEEPDKIAHYEAELTKILNGRRETQIRELIAQSEKDIKEAEDASVAAQGAGAQAVIHFEYYGVGIVNGMLIQARREMYESRRRIFALDEKNMRAKILSSHPEWFNKAYIYLAVRGGSLPHPSQSFPGPSQFTLYTSDKPRVFAERVLPGFIFRHEAAHYENDSDNKEERERMANLIAYERLMEAWKNYKENGDSSGYAFVFVNFTGVTITQRTDKSFSRLI